MLENYNYLLVQFYDGDEHLCQLFETMDEIAEQLQIHRSTIYNNYDKDKKYYQLKCNKQMYYIKKL